MMGTCALAVWVVVGVVVEVDIPAGIAEDIVAGTAGDNTADTAGIEVDRPVQYPQ
jgi:hypothetical protein